MVDMVDMAVICSGRDPGSADMTQSVPAYEQLAELFRAKIRAGELQPGDRLPSANALKAEGWKHHAVISAMRVLRIEGWTRGEPGRAVYVADQPPITRSGDTA